MLKIMMGRGSQKWLKVLVSTGAYVDELLWSVLLHQGERYRHLTIGLQVAQLGKNPHPVWESWVWSLGREDSMEEGIATHSSILAWKIPIGRGAWRARVHGDSLQDMTQNSIYCPWRGATGGCLCFMTILFFLGLFWPFPFAFLHSHFSD